MVQTSCYLKRHLERFLTSFGLDWPTAYGYFGRELDDIRRKVYFLMSTALSSCFSLFWPSF